MFRKECLLLSCYNFYGNSFHFFTARQGKRGFYLDPANQPDWWRRSGQAFQSPQHRDERYGTAEKPDGMKPRKEVHIKIVEALRDYVSVKK